MDIDFTSILGTAINLTKTSTYIYANQNYFVRFMSNQTAITGDDSTAVTTMFCHNNLKHKNNFLDFTIVSYALIKKKVAYI